MSNYIFLLDVKKSKSNINIPEVFSDVLLLWAKNLLQVLQAKNIVKNVNDDDDDDDDDVGDDDDDEDADDDDAGDDDENDDDV